MRENQAKTIEKEIRLHSGRVTGAVGSPHKAGHLCTAILERSIMQQNLIFARLTIFRIKLKFLGIPSQ